MKTVFEDRVKLCGLNKNVSFLNEDGVCRQGKAMLQHPKTKVKLCGSMLSKDGFLRQGQAMRQHPKQERFPKTGQFETNR
ncbi:UNVERIFIED_CONTAM: hypothetical protein NCL1_31235 [Trichonephila clavipes]